MYKYKIYKISVTILLTVHNAHYVHLLETNGKKFS